MALGLINALPRSSLALSTAWFVSHASLAAPCPITISGLASPEWLRAVAAVGELDADGDCASIALAVDADGALLSFTTRDGRVAHRQLTHPSELGATVDALTTVPLTDEARPHTSRATPEPSGATPAPGLRDSTAIAPGTQLPSASTSETAPAPIPDAVALDTRRGTANDAAIEARGKPDDLDATIAFAVGSRAGQGGLASPVLATSGSVNFERWHVGAQSALELQYFDLIDHDEERRKSSAISFGARAGRHQPAGPVMLSVAGHAAVAALFHDSTGDDGAEVRTGVAASVAYPRGASTRLRAELGADVVVAGHRPGPITPAWAFTTLLGFEFGARAR